MRKTSAVLVAVGLSLLVLGLVGCSKKKEASEAPAAGNTPASTINAVLALKGDANAGKTVFANSCITCHGVEGKGGIPNPGSTDGTIPELKPIDEEFGTAPAIVKVLEEGSKPEGEKVEKEMPAFGQEKSLTDQQMADVTAYILSINGK